MSSYIRKINLFFALFMIISMSNASEVHNINPAKPDTHLEQMHKTIEAGTSHSIAGHIQTLGNVLSSPSNLAEQAKSYALGKFNNTVSSEAQKWLSQFGAVRVNFGLDRKWKLKNSSLDILLPLYDNKADWLLFSQLGYRNKNSRNTVNLGLGGRYFNNNWMYGLNTFYDHELTVGNQRLGLGGEFWGDYIKFSANAYYRLSNWQESRKFQDYYERPATGYDINGEFFLSVYPNLGAKLTYEQYFGDNVTLFNRDTKQKNPRQAKLDLTYTPIPLVTIGVGYRQGEEGHTDTQFQANLNYKFGIPLNTQLSPANVALMRTLAGSRYDFVGRNNDIVMAHQKREKDELFTLGPIIGYGQQEIPINAPIHSYTNIKHISWVVPDKAFKDNHGKLSSDSGRSIVITLPSYQETHKIDYKLDILITDNQGKTQPIQTTIKVLPFLIDGEVNITGNEKNGYTFSDPIITYQGSPDGEFVKNARINKVTWTTEPALGDESGLSFKWNDKPAQTSEKGELTNKEGKLTPNILISKKPHNEVKVYIQLDGAPRQEIGTVKFSTVKYHVKNLAIDKKSPLTANGEESYTYTAYIIDQDGNPVAEGRTISNVQWNKDNNNPGLKFTFKNGEDKTGKGGTLTATLSSTADVDNVVVSLAVEDKKSPLPATAVSFVVDPKQYRVKNLAIDKKSPLTANGEESYTYTAYIIDQDGNPVAEGRTISNVQWNKDNNNPGLKFTFKNGEDKTGKGGTLTATLSSTADVDNVVVSLAVEDKKSPLPATAVSFVVDPKQYRVKNLAIDKKSPLTANGEESYTYTAYIIDQDGNPVAEGRIISNVQWNKDNNHPGLKFTFKNGEDKTGKGGTLTATLSSTAYVDNVVVSLAVEEQTSPILAKPVKFILDEKDLEINISISSTGPLMANNSDTYIYTATITDKKTNSNVSNYTFDSVEWTLPDNITGMTVSKDSDVTDAQGNLVARVKSHVGIDDFSVKLTLNKKISKTSDKRTFNPIPKKAEIFLYNNQNSSVNSDNKNIIFSNAHAPVNAFYSLSGALRNSNGEKITKSNNQSVIFTSTNPDITSIDADTGEISFNKPGNATLSATITNKSNSIKELYVYMTKVKRYFSQDPSSYDDIQWNNGKKCETNGLVTPNFKADIFNDNSNNNENVPPVLAVEFPDISLWNLLPTGSSTNSSTSSGTIFFFVKDDSNDYLIYNSWDHSTPSASLGGGGYLLCVVK
ncbi:inverse autotransporter beta domain-containing protein [Xenorhabdus sp. SGI240]|uniref:inverse autotransporter beta domain-containing protein n=1 Tax=Xenorhabdus sp. SGI240 TaxID=3158262 RepID=UPI0032B6FCAE